MPLAASVRAAAIASSGFSPGMNRAAAARTKPKRGEWSRSQRLSEARTSIRRIKFIGSYPCGPLPVSFSLRRGEGFEEALVEIEAAEKRIHAQALVSAVRAYVVEIDRKPRDSIGRHLGGIGEHPVGGSRGHGRYHGDRWEE